MVLSKQTGEAAGVSSKTADAVLTLLSEGATIPFIARYRKELTGGLDETQIMKIRDTAEELKALHHRRDYIIKTIEAQGKLSPALKQAIQQAQTLMDLEDLYLPFKKGRQTRADRAREKGLGPAAEAAWGNPESPLGAIRGWATTNGLQEVQETVGGVQDILAEGCAQNHLLRSALREVFNKKSYLTSTCIKARLEKPGSPALLSEYQKFKDYYDWKEGITAVPGHRIHAVFRGMSLGILRVKVEPPEDEVFSLMEASGLPMGWKKSRGEDRQFWEQIYLDSYKRLLFPSLQNEIFQQLKQKADAQSVELFAGNIRSMLLAPPFRRTPVLAVDPGFRTGCKAVVLDADGRLLHWQTIFPTEPRNDLKGTREFIETVVEDHGIGCVAVGNGTAGRETEQIIRDILQNSIPVLLVDERGASVYSASESARREFPELDVTYRGAVSIGRRLQDPLNELVKIHPWAMGVGQYQHDVDQALLKKRLGEEVELCVNAVGVDINRAGTEILSYISGFTQKTAQAVVEHRSTQGPFTHRRELLKVPGVGEKAFQQAAGFLRIPGGHNPLDATGIHPEMHGVIEDLEKISGTSVADIMVQGGFSCLPHKPLETWKKKWFSSQSGFGLPTLTLIEQELAHPGRDPRPEFEIQDFDPRVHSLEDLEEGQILPGKVTNITSFGAFVDLGVHQDGLIHISKLDTGFVRDPAAVVAPGEWVTVRILGLDLQRKRISLERLIPSKGKSSP